MAGELGTPFMRWQQHVADVALEVLPSGQLAFREVIVSVMRQNGKTTLVLAAHCARCLMWGSEQRVAYTAQTGKDARTKFKEDHKPLIEKSALAHLVTRFYMSDGNTSLVWKNGSRVSVLDNTPSAGHGKTLDLAVIDEAFADQSNAREQALLPTMATRANPQIWNVSTAGTQSSAYLLRKVEVGRQAVREGKTSGIAYFEWSVPEDEDPYDLGVLAERMPAYGVTINDEFILHAQETMTDGDYRRAIGNQWTEAEDRILPLKEWTGVQDVSAVPGSDRVIGVDMNPERSQVSAVGSDPSGVVEVIDYGDVSGLVDRVKTLAVSHGAPVAIDAGGPAASIIPDLQAENVTLIQYNGRDLANACGRFYDQVMAGTLRIRPDRRLDDAAAGATRRSLGDAWAWGRKQSSVDISPLVAATLAVDAAIKPKTEEYSGPWVYTLDD